MSTLNFVNLDESLVMTLLRPVQTLDLTTRGKNVLNSMGITTVGELMQLTENQLLGWPNVGRSTVKNVKEILAELDLSLGTSITNWPGKHEVSSLLASRGQLKLDKSNLLEEELCATVRAAVNASAFEIVIKRTGWDGGQTRTLAELANDPRESGLSSPVTRERVRQIERVAMKSIQNLSFPTPILNRTISLIEENAPILASTLPSLLQRHKLTKCGLGLEAISVAMKLFKVEWNLVCTSIGQDLFLLPSDHAEKFEFVWNILIDEGLHRDFVPLDNIRRLDSLTDNLMYDITALGISQIPTLDWLDRRHRIYWAFNRISRGWNKIVNVFRKVLTVAPEVPIKKLVRAVHRAKTTRDCASQDVLEAMLRTLDEFEIKNEIVSRGTNFSPVELSKSEHLMINAARDAGTVTTFLNLRDSLVRQGLSTNHAQVLMITTPFWITTARGKYRFIANESHLDKLPVISPSEQKKSLDSNRILVELLVTHRHVVTGTHRINQNLVKQGEWLLKDQMGNVLGKLEVTLKSIKGLNSVFATASIEAGDSVVIDFSDEKFKATLSTEALD